MRDIDGDIVECGLSVVHGALQFPLVSDYLNRARNYLGFDFFEGFPDPIDVDRVTRITGKGFGESPPDIAYRVVRDGRVGEDDIRDRVRLVRYFSAKGCPPMTGTSRSCIWIAI